MLKQGEASREVELLPIDIYYNKLLDWLLDRRHCEVRWQTTALVIREKINTAIQDMPEVEEITQLLSGTFINYFHCLRIVELLKVSESASRNIFGRYSSQRMKDWQEIVHLYEKDNVYLAEAAHLLARNVNYEIPVLKKQIGRCQQAQRECTRKESEYTSNSASFREKYQLVCRQMGIKGENVKSELMNLLNDLPEIYEDISMATEKLCDATNYYEAFVGFVAPRYNPDKDTDKQTTPLLRHIQEHGNTTVYQWKNGKAPSAVLPDLQASNQQSNEEGGSAEVNSPNDQVVPGEEENAGNEIDFGDGAAGTIDFGDNGADTIDFGDSATDTIDFGDDEAGISVEENGTGGISLECSGEGEDVATGTDALKLLDNTSTRNVFINELMELEGFLGQRVLEMKKESDVLSAHQFQSAPQIVQGHSIESVQAMQAGTKDVLAKLTSLKMQNLFALKSSPRYVDRLADSLQQKLKIAEKLRSSCKTMADKRQAAIEEQRGLEPKLEIIRTRTKETKDQIAQAISTKYQGRPINIMGEINTM